MSATKNINFEKISGAPFDISMALSDETSLLTATTSSVTVYAPYAFTITNIYASLSTSGSSVSTFDVNVNNVSILSTKLTIDANEFHSKDAATPAIISATTIALYDKISVDVDGGGTGSKGAKLYILGTRT